MSLIQKLRNLFKGGRMAIPSQNYSDEQLAFIQKLTTEEHTANEIAALFTDKFGRMISRNSVIGLWSRKSVIRVPRERVTPPKRIYPSRAKVKKIPDPVKIAKAERVKAMREIKMTDPWKPLEGVEPVRLIDRELSQCKWPLDTWDDYGVRKSCGAKTELDGHNYCSTHAAVAYRPAERAR